MKITDQKILAALQNGKRIRQPNFTSNDEFFLSSNGFTITSSGRIFVTGKENAPIPMQIDLLASDDWESWTMMKPKVATMCPNNDILDLCKTSSDLLYTKGISVNRI